MRRVAVIGLDGVSWDVLLGYIDYLPNLRRLLAGSVISSMLCKPPLTPPSWTSIFTGVIPEKHKVLGFVRYSKKNSRLTYRFYSAKDIAVPRISEILAFHDFSSVLINHILSYPISAWYRKNHVIVYDILSPKKFVYPQTHRKYLRYFDYPKTNPKGGRVDILKKWAKSIELRVDGTIKLVEEVSPNLLIEVVSETDSAIHRVPPVAAGKFVDGYLKILEVIDELVDFAMKHFDAILLVSDHGMRLFSKGINLQLLLRAVEGERGAFAQSLKKVIVASAATLWISEWLGYKALSSMKTYRHFYQIRDLLRKNIAGNSNSISKDSNVHLDAVDANDAMMLYFTNRRKRENAHRLAEAIFGNLLNEVKKIDVGSVPSLMVVPTDGFYLNTDSIYRTQNAKIIYFPSARHSTLGIFALWRKGHNISKHVGIVKNVDVVPTILSCLRLPLPSYTDGKTIIDERVKYIDYMPRWKVSKRVSFLRSSLR